MRSRFLPHLNVHVFVVFLIVSLPILAAGALLVLGSGQARLRQSYGFQLAEVAEQAAAAVDSYVFQRILDASILSQVPDVRAVAAVGNRQAWDADAARRLEQERTQARKIPPSLATVLTNPATRFLSDVARVDPIFRELSVTDQLGRLVATSNITAQYLQASQPWWREAYGDGAHGRVSVSDVSWDDSAQAYLLVIATPVTEATSEAPVIGVLKVVLDIREIQTIVSGVRRGTTGQTTLVRDNASIVLSPRRLDPNARFFAADLLLERLKTVRQGDPLAKIAFTANAVDGSRQLVAVAPSQLGSSYPHLTWLIAVSEAEDELFAPVRADVWYLLFVLALTAMVTLAFTVYLSLKLAAPPEELEMNMHLTRHPPVHLIAEDEVEEST